MRSYLKRRSADKSAEEGKKPRKFERAICFEQKGRTVAAVVSSRAN